MTDSILGQVALREALVTDLPLVFSDWLKSYRKSDATKRFSHQIYFDGQRALIERLLKRSVLRLVVAKDDPNQIFGWVCFERTPPIPVLHYLYVKHKFRGFGLGRLLVSDFLDTPVVYSHEGAFKEKLAQGSYFNPYKAMG